MPEYLTPLAGLSLGDIIHLPDGRGLTVRAKAVLPVPVDAIAGFVVLGELELLLASPDSASAPIAVYVRQRYVDATLKRAVEVAHGVCSYWAPHLPGVAGAMSELGYRVLRVPGSAYPAIVIYRGKEPILFMRASDLPPADVRVQKMTRSDDEPGKVARYSTTVINSPLHEPEKVPEPAPSLYERVVKAGGK